jgi:uncharacterized protein with gpF-like domain
MTAQVLFNQLTYIDRLTRGGFTPDQARASAEALEFAFSESVATRSDIAELKHQIESVKTDLEHQIGSVKTDLEHQIGSVKSDLEHQIGSVKADLEHQMTSIRSEITTTEKRLELKIANTKNETLRWIFAFNLGLVGAIFTIIKYVH